MSFLLNHNYRFYINELLKGNDPNTNLRIGKGITSIDPDNNEESDETYYYDGGGAAERDITGYMLSYAFEGHRNYGDPAQDKLMALATKTGPDRKLYFVVEEPDGTVIEGPATVSDIVKPGGDANAKGEISFTISFDGTPEITDPPENNDYPALNTPINLAATSGAITATEIGVTWDFTPPTGTTKAVEFDVFVNGEFETTVTVNSAVVTDLTASTEYTITVQAKYADNPIVKSLVSDPLKATTIA